MKREQPKQENDYTALLKSVGTKQQTLEEAAEIFYSEQSKAYEDASEPTFDNSRYLVAGFIDGAKWQQEQDKNKYSEEEVRQMLWSLGDVLFNNNQNGIEEGEPEKHFEVIIKQFKNK